MMMKSKKNTPPDQTQRDLILKALDKTMLVEAAAGTGKTTSLVGRMVNLIGEGHCRVETLAAVTFTRKAAAELRSRFQVALERTARTAKGETQDRLAEAVRHVERCFIGTIHSFCARLLRERPVEAGVDVSFDEIDEADDARLREEAWQQYAAMLFARSDTILSELDEVGLEVSSLAAAFERLVLYPDVEEWPAPDAPLPDLLPATGALRSYARHMESLLPTFPADIGNDGLMPKYRAITRAVRQAILDRPADLMDVLGLCTEAKIVQRNWPGGKEQAKEELARWDEFREEYVDPLLATWRTHRYGIVMRAVRPAVSVCDRMRMGAGRLNFQDLLMRSAALLRDKPNIRRYFRRRFTHLLVDEFQDTDPIQAQVMMFLVADDAEEADWRKCRPVDGSLFVVGDPKQSIYRFRRADIVTYNQVRDIIAGSGGLVVNLSANFRSVEPIIEWVNVRFSGVFPENATGHSPANVPLKHGRVAGSDGELLGLRVLWTPADFTRKEDVLEYDSSAVAAFIRKAIDEKMTVPRTKREVENGAQPYVTPGDFLILAKIKAHLGLYARKLQELGVPHLVTGGTALNQVAELHLLLRCLTSVTQPNNPVILVAVLRSELFGVSDAALYAFKRAGGMFSFRMPLPEGLEGETRTIFEDAFARLKRYFGWLDVLSPVAAIEKIVADLGLALRAGVAQGGDVQAGSLAKAIELLRSAQSGTWTAAGCIEYLADLVDLSEPYDGIPAKPHEGAPVRLMNLHKAKGLEAPVVFLADPTGESDYPPTLYVDRSGKNTRGFMAVYGQATGRAKPPLLAHPQGWDKLTETERAFADAEDTRLFYVAATRAGAAMVISERTKNNRGNPWGYFEDDLEVCSALDVPQEVKVCRKEGKSVARKEVAAALTAIGERWAVSAAPSYAIAAAKQLALAPVASASPGEHGTEWGTVIHMLLEAAMRDPRADLAALARSACAEYGLWAEAANEAVTTVDVVRRSDLWRRAMSASRRMVEVPFEYALPANGGAKVPTLVRGVIDLAFREDGGWVIVDYKTDAAARERQAELEEHYRPQVQSYAKVWEQFTNEKVREAGLFFTRNGVYVWC